MATTDIPTADHGGNLDSPRFNPDRKGKFQFSFAHFLINDDQAVKRAEQLAEIMKKPLSEIAASELLMLVIDGLHFHFTDEDGNDQYTLTVDSNLSEALEVFDVFGHQDIEPEAVWEFQETGCMLDCSPGTDPDMDRDDDGI